MPRAGGCASLQHNLLLGQSWEFLPCSHLFTVFSFDLVTWEGNTSSVRMGGRQYWMMSVITNYSNARPEGELW